MSDLVIYDKVKWHFEASDYPKDLPESHAYIHGGIFLGWCVEHGLVSSEFTDDFAEEMAAFKEHELSGPQLLQITDGAILSDMFTEEGNQFVAAYYDLEVGLYLSDFLRTVAVGLPTEYHATDSWENYARMASVISERFNAWQRGGSVSLPAE